jgi:hypothetical protein
MSQYLLSVHHSESSPLPSDEDMPRIFAAVDAFNDEVRAAGAWVFAGGLHPIESTTVVDATGAETIVTDGPFAESKEYLGGFWIIEAADLDEALSWAKRGSAACAGPVEVRPFQDEPA